MTPETLSGDRVGEVDLHKGEPHTHQPVAQSHARVGQPSLIDQKTVDPLAGILQEVEDGSLRVGLEGLDLHTQLGTQRFHGTVDVVQRVGSVNLGFPAPEQAEVGTVDECDAHDLISLYDSPASPSGASDFIETV